MDIELIEYSYVGLSGTLYHPIVNNGEWRLILSCSFDDVIFKCNISDEDAIILKLKYGG